MRRAFVAAGTVAPKASASRAREKRAMLSLVALAAAAALAVVPLPSPSPSSDVPPAAAALFAAARDAWRAKPVPPYISYTQTGHFTAGRRVDDVRYEVLYRSRDRRAVERRFDDPHADAKLAFGAPSLAPDATFGVAPRTPGESARLVESSPAEPLPQIGRITAVSASPYTIADTGEETLDGRACRHLTLAPRSDPRRYRLRAAWIDPRTLDIVKLAAVADVHAGPIHKLVPYDVTFHEVGGYWMIDRFHIAGTARFLFASLSGEGTIVFPRIEYPASLPDSTFERATYEGRR